MAKTSIQHKVATAVWVRAGGRCEYRGCNQYLVGDLISGKRNALLGYLAHIVGDSADGPRGDTIQSPLLAKEASNLMLMCSKHHKIIDVDGVAEHSVELLRDMKDRHETRIAINTGIDEEYSSHVLRFGASIGKNEALVSTAAIFAAMPPDRHPATTQTIDLEMINQVIKDDEPEFWEMQRTNLIRLFSDRVGGRIERQEIRHLSVFALAPQPLLIELGRLLNEIVEVTVHNKHREPSSWKWQRDRPVLSFNVSRPLPTATGAIALKIAVSGTVNDDRITSVLGDDPAIWSVTIANPGNDVVRQPEDLAAYRATMRAVYNEIQAHHGQANAINLFPAMPASLAVETGRVWMPKANLPMLIYDQTQEKGFIPTLTIR